MLTIPARHSALALSLVQFQSKAQPFKAFYADHGATVEKWVRNACLRVGLVDAIEQQDIQQDVWERLLRLTRPYDGVRSVKAYFYGLAQTAANGAKRLRRRHVMDVSDADMDRPGVTRETQHGPMLAWGEGFGISPLPGESQWNAAIDVDTILAAEPANVCRAAELTYWQDMTVREAATIMGSHYATVSRTLAGLHQRARVRLAA